MNSRLLILSMILLCSISIVSAAVNLVVTAPTAGTNMTGQYGISFTFDNNANVTIEFYNGTGWQTINTSTNATGAPYTYTFDTTAYADAVNYEINITVTNYSNATDIETSNIANLGIDNTAPSVNLLNSSGTTTNQTPTINFNYTDSIAPTANCTLYFDGTDYGTNSSTDNNTNSAIVVNTTLADGAYTVYVNCTDSVGLVGQSSSITVTVDTTGPIITELASGSITSSQATITWTTNEDANSTVLYGVTTALGNREGAAAYTTGHSINLNGLSARTLYYYNVTSCDQLGFCNTSAQGQFTTATASGGGGGGGGSPPGLSAEPTRVTLWQYGRYSFQGTDRKVHDIRISSMTETSVTFLISSSPVEVTLNLGESVNIDLTQDGEPEFYIELLSIDRQSVDFNLGLPPEDEEVIEGIPVVEEEETSPEPEVVPEPEPAPEPAPPVEEPAPVVEPEPEEESSKAWVGIVIVLVAAFIAFLVWAVKTEKIGMK